MIKSLFYNHKMINQLEVNIVYTDEDRIEFMNRFLDVNNYKHLVIIDVNIGYNILHYIEQYHYNNYRVVIDIEEEEDSLIHPSVNRDLDTKIIHIRRSMDLETKTLIESINPIVVFF